MKYILTASILINVWFATAIARLESFHYSTNLEISQNYTGGGSCGLYDDTIRRSAVGVCLENRKVRTSEFANLLYGLKIL